MIIDASVAVKWIVEEPGCEAARALIGRNDLLAPRLMFCEVGNALWKSVMRGHLDPRSPLREQLEDLSEVVTVVDETGALPRALELAIRFKHGIYNCVYLALAEQLDDQMMTADEDFVRALRADHLARHVRALQ